MKNSAMAIAVLAAVVSLTAGAADKYWCGGGETDNMSEDANWTDGVAPATGDKLHFGGNERTTPYNDFDPASFKFPEIQFHNDGSSLSNAAFTISGNELVLSTGHIRGVNPSVKITNVFNCDISLKNNCTFGGMAANADKIHFVFNGKMTSANKYVTCSSQYKGSLTFNGDLSGFTSIGKSNGGAPMYFNGVTTGTTAYDFAEGSLYCTDATNVGTGQMAFGQGGYNTAGALQLTPTNDVTLVNNIVSRCPGMDKTGAQILNNTAGTTLTLTGTITGSGTGGSRISFGGAGDGVIEGAISTTTMAFRKAGTGTWTISDASDTCSMTGLVTVAAGTLVVNRSLQPNQKISVSASAKIKGQATVGDRMTFASNSKYEVTGDGTNLAKLDVGGEVVLNGGVTVSLVGTLPGVRTKLLGFTSKSGTGNFSVGTGFPDGATFSIENDGLYVTIPSSTLTWTGDASGVWDTSAENWGTGQVFADDANVVFPDLSDAAKRAVEIPSAVKPLTLTVNAAGANAYTFSGNGGLAAVPSITIAGTATNVFDTPISDVTSFEVRAGGAELKGDASDVVLHVFDGGHLRLDGAYENGTILVDNGGKMIQGTNSVISGTTQVRYNSAKAGALYGTNTFTGGLVLGADYSQQNGAGAPRTRMDVYSPQALGDGDVTLFHNALLVSHCDVAVSNHLLRLVGYNNDTQVSVDANKTFEWAGDVDISQPIQSEVFAGSGNYILGKKEGGSTIVENYGRNLTIVGNAIHLYASWQSQSSLGSRATLHLYGDDNRWSEYRLNQFRAVLHRENTLPWAPVRMMQVYGKVPFHVTLDMNGCSQCISRWYGEYDNTIENSGTFTSATPATLTISNVTDTVTDDVAVFKLTGAVTLRKAGSAKWTAGIDNTSTGNVEVVGGTLKITNAKTMPDGRESKLVMGDGRLEIADGVAAEISYADRIVHDLPKMVPSGLYGGADCADAAATKVDWITGTGTLRVKYSKTGTVLIVR